MLLACHAAAFWCWDQECLSTFAQQRLALLAAGSNAQSGAERSVHGA